MSNESLIALSSLIVAFASLITGLILQKESKKLREIESENKKLGSQLKNALLAIKSYQIVECENVDKEGLDIANYRRKVRKNSKAKFNSSSLLP